MIDVAEQRDRGGHVHVDLDTLATALYVRIDDELKASPQINRQRPKVGIAPKITDAELLTVSVLQALLGYHKEARWLRFARRGIRHLFPYLPKQSGYNKRLRTLTVQMSHIIAVLVADTDLWQHPIRIADSTPVPCGTSRETVKRSDLAGWAGYGYCASHSRRAPSLASKATSLVDSVHPATGPTPTISSWTIGLPRPGHRSVARRPRRHHCDRTRPCDRQTRHAARRRGLHDRPRRQRSSPTMVARTVTAVLQAHACESMDHPTGASIVGCSNWIIRDGQPAIGRIGRVRRPGSCRRRRER